MECNGKHYPMWGQFVERQKEFIGKELVSQETGMTIRTKVTGMSLEPNGKDSAFFSVNGEDFNCGFDVRHGGITGGKEGWLTFAGYGGHTFAIQN